MKRQKKRRDMEWKEEEERRERQRIERAERAEKRDLLRQQQQQQRNVRAKRRQRIDFISSLPDCLLTHILSFLPTRDAVLTSILSSRWRTLWTLVPVLDLEQHKLYMLNRNLNFLDTLSSIWTLRNATVPLRKFHLHWTSDCDSSYVDTLIQHTVLHGRVLQELHLCIYSDPNPHLKLHPALFFSTTLVVLKLESFIHLNPPSDSSFPALRIMEIGPVIRYENCDSLPTLLAACPLLQELNLTVSDSNFCCLEANTGMLKIIVLIPTLKKLYLYWFLDGWCYTFLHYYILQLNTPALEQFYFSGLLAKDVTVENLPNLVKSGLEFEEIENDVSTRDYAKRIWDFMGSLYNVESMEFSIETAEILCYGSIDDLPVFNNLTSLTIGGCIKSCYYMWPAVQLLLCQAPKTKQLDGNLPSELEEFLNNNQGVEMVVKLGRENTTLSSDSVTKDQGPYPSAETQETTVAHNTAELENVETLKDTENKAGKRKRQGDQVGVQSMEMLKVRASLEERLKQEGILSSRASKSDKAQKRLKPVNGRLVTYDDFDDDAIDVGATRFSNGHPSSLSTSKLSQIVSAKTNKPKAVSGDDDLPKRDDIGERRRKHELRVLAGAGIKSEDDVVDEVDNFEVNGDADMGDGDTGDSEDEYYKQAEQRRAAKLAAKAEMYSRTSAVVPSSLEPIDGKRYITYEMEKNRGLTRNRKNQTKNPRKKYKEQHKKKVNRRKGQVQEIKKPIGPYGGEASGINVATSRSVRFKN